MLTRAPHARAPRTQLPHLALARALPRARTRRDAKLHTGCACSNVNCPANSNSPVGSSDSSACACNAGYFGDAKAGCTKCPAGSYCPGGTEKKACPAWSSSDRGSSKLIDCVCNVGYMGTGVAGCSLCPVDSYCPGDGKVFQCTENANAKAGSAKCTCRDGWSEKKDGRCIRCPAGFYCPPEQDHQAMQCPANTQSPPGSIAQHNCKCLAGFENTAYEVKSNFFKVSAGDFAQVRDRCKQGGGEIASINTMREQMAALQVCSKCWIALAQRSPGSPWQNLDKHPVDFTAWALGKPDAAGMNYARACGASKDQACPAQQISTGYGAPAERAVDGNSNSNWGGASCTATNAVPAGRKQWWRVDMQQEIVVTSLVAAGRADCCEERTQGYTIFVGNEEPGNLEKNAVCVQDQPNLPKGGLVQTINCNSPVRGRYVYFVVPAGQVLTLCEVQVFGMPVTGGSLNVIYGFNDKLQSAQWDDFPASATFEGLCKKAAVPPTCTQISTPLLLGMNPGFITDFYYVGKDISDFPYDVVTTSVPNSEFVADQIPFYDDDQFNKLDKNVPPDRFAMTWTGMLGVEVGGTYTFTTESDDGSHLYVDGKMVVDNGGARAQYCQR